MTDRIIYTETDEAPALATYSFLPVVRSFTKAVGVSVVSSDISLAARILAAFPEYLKPEQVVNDNLKDLGKLAKSPKANIVKLPNISASLPQLQAAIEELQAEGFALPDYPEIPTSQIERTIKRKYDKVKGSAVNPVLREGNSDRRAPKAVKAYAQKNPHRMGEWNKDSKSHVASMRKGDFMANEKSHTLKAATKVNIELHSSEGEVSVLKANLSLEAGEVIDGAFMSKKALLRFLKQQKEEAKKEGVLYSLHMKATMMKVSDPIIFGHAVRSYFEKVFEKHAKALTAAAVNPNDGLKSLLNQITVLPPAEREAIEKDLEKAMEKGPDLAMVNSDEGITNLHVPSDVIIDASMPAMIRTSGKMWNKQGEPQDAKAIIPDSSYADLYQETISFCKKHGAFDPTTMGTVPNVGLMAKKAEEYGSHDKTFELKKEGIVKVIDQEGKLLMKHKVEAGDIWRMCQTKDDAVENWVGLAVKRARATGWPAVFWLDENRAHDAELIKKVRYYLKDHDTEDLVLKIMSTKEASRYTLERVKAGKNTISVTGNVLRDYLTDLFPILELGTSAKMLSIVPLLNGGGLFETGAGGSAPKHVQQFVKENHLRWDSLGEFLALVPSLEHLAESSGNQQAKILADCLDQATTKYLMQGKSPSRKVNEPDNRASHFYLALYWAESLAEQTESKELQERFKKVAKELRENEEEILSELNLVQGKKVDLGGYYYPDKEKVAKAMRPSLRLNAIIDQI